MKPRKNYRERPKKTGARKNAKVRSQKKKLIDAGHDAEVLEKMTVVEVRELLKESARKSTKKTHLTQKTLADAAKRSAAARKTSTAKKRAGRKKPGKKAR